MRSRIVIALLVSFALTAVAPAVAASADPTIGSFTIGKRADEMSDADRSYIMNFNADAKASLGWKCEPDGLNVKFIWSRYLMGNSRTDTITIAYRFAPQAAVTRQWDLQRSHKDAYMPMSDVQAFTQEALTAETVLLRVTDVDGDSITASFKLDGLAEALKTLPCANATPLVSKR